MKKTVLFVILEQFADWEVAYLSSAIQMLAPGQYDTKTVSLTKDAVSTIGGFHVLPDYDLKTSPTEYEALILVGGMSWRTEEAKQINSLVQHAMQNKKLLGGICDASAFLGTLGVLNKGYHTSNDLNNLKQWAGNAYTGDSKYKLEQAVCDEHIVTANGTAALEFAKEVLFALNVAPKNKILEWYDFHKLGYYNVPTPKM